MKLSVTNLTPSKLTNNSIVTETLERVFTVSLDGFMTDQPAL